jgi:carbonic anhydrase
MGLPIGILLRLVAKVLFNLPSTVRMVSFDGPQKSHFLLDIVEPQSPDFERIQGVLKNYGQYPGISYPTSAGTLEHLGDTLKFTPKTPNGVFERLDGAYSLIQWHVHTPSEHRVNGIDYPAEIHFVHKKNDKLAVIGAFVDFSSKSSPFIADMVQVCPRMN